MPRHLSIDTAYARNIEDPLILTIDGEDFHVDPGLDIARMAAVFAGFREGAAALGDTNRSIEERAVLMTEMRADGVQALSACIVTAEQERFREKATERYDYKALTETVTWIMSEVSGQPNPTQQESSAPG